MRRAGAVAGLGSNRRADSLRAAVDFLRRVPWNDCVHYSGVRHAARRVTKFQLAWLEKYRMSNRLVGRPLVAGIAFALVLISVARADEDRFAPLKARLQSFIDEGQVSGVVAAVFDGETEHSIALGLANREKQTKMSDDTLFGVMSMTKPITAAAIM